MCECVSVCVRQNKACATDLINLSLFFFALAASIWLVTDWFRRKPKYTPMYERVT